MHVDPTRGATLLFDAYLGALCRWFRAPRSDEVTLIAEIDAVVDLVLRGLEPTPVDRSAHARDLSRPG